MTMTSRILSAALLAAICGASAQQAATPPSLVNYQGVLRDRTTGLPLNATVKAVFTFYPDAGSTGTDILSDLHSGVVVSNGLFSLQLGGGVVADGGGAGTYASLSEVFRDYSDVWMEIQVETETLTPRVRVAGAAYASNTSYLEGRAASEFINTSTERQSKAGPLTVDSLSTVYFDSARDVYVGGDGYVVGRFTVEGDTVFGDIQANRINASALQLPDGTATITGRSPLQIATLHWYGASEQNTFPVGDAPIAVAFDGSSVWVGNNLTDNVTKLRASDGALLGTFPAGSRPYGVAFDGSSIWVANNGGNSVTKLRASDGAVLGTFPAGNSPIAVAFDGSSIWVANHGSGNVTKLRASDGALLGTLPVGRNPFAVAFDGSSLWVANSLDNNVTKLRAADGALLGTFPVGIGPTGVAFDGSSIWVTNSGSGNVTKLRASDGAVLGTFLVGSLPYGVAFDGSNVWVANYYSNTVTKLRASDGAVLGTFPVASYPIAVAFDGASIWVAHLVGNTVSKL